MIKLFKQINPNLIKSYKKLIKIKLIIKKIIIIRIYIIYTLFIKVYLKNKPY